MFITSGSKRVQPHKRKKGKGPWLTLNEAISNEGKVLQVKCYNFHKVLSFDLSKKGNYWTFCYVTTDYFFLKGNQTHNRKSSNDLLRINTKNMCTQQHPCIWPYKSFSQVPFQDAVTQKQRTVRFSSASCKTNQSYLLTQCFKALGFKGRITLFNG